MSIKYTLFVFVFILPLLSIDESRNNSTCLSDADCDPPFMICSPNTQTCQHKPLFPLTVSEIIGTVLIVGLGSIATVAGLGGGVIVIPLILLLFGVTIKEAAAISNVIILVNSTVKFINGFGKKDPLKPTKTLIDYHFVLMFNPVFIVSNVFGSILNKMLPSGYVLCGLISMVLIVMVINIRNGIKKYKEENEEVERQKLLKENLLGNDKDSEAIELKEKGKFSRIRPIDITNAESDNDFNNKTGQPSQNRIYGTSPTHVLPHISMQQFNDPEFKEILKNEGKDFNSKTFALFSLTVFTVVFFSLLRGSREFESIVGMEFCGGIFWLTLILMIIFILAIAVYSTRLVHKEIAIKAANNHLMPHELNYDFKTTLRLNIVLFVFGVISNILGLGGALFIYPLFTGLGMQPVVVSYTALFMIFQSKLVAVVLNYLGGLIIADLAIYFVVIMSVGSYFIVKKMNQIIAKYKRQSLLTVLMVFVLAVSLIISPLYGYLEGSKSPDFWSFRSFC